MCVTSSQKYLNIRENLGLPANIMDVYSDFVLQNLLDIEDSPSILGMQLADVSLHVSVCCVNVRYCRRGLYYYVSDLG